MSGRTSAFLAACMLALGLAGCAASGPRSAEGPAGPSIETLTEQCVARGGTLAPSGGALTGRPSLDYNCRISSSEPRRQ